ncbi:MAG: hypothetical protein DA407_09280 [Bacteroidetes bacterium]|nr:MAG: hypothetical protein DA407_09280 [Bacteroidota bacterium]
MKITKKINASVAIALTAVLISTISVFISLKETEILIAQKEASIWPYMENSIDISKNNDSTYMIRVSSQNKGVGPAILDSVFYGVKNKEFQNWRFHSQVQKLYPKLKILNFGNAELSNKVLASNEKFNVFSIKIINQGHFTSIDLNRIVNEIASDIYLRYSYTSIYGKCWMVKGYTLKRAENCNYWKEIQ